MAKMIQTKDQTINLEEYITEGKAKIFTKELKTNHKGTQFIEEAFYNPVQKFNRDLTLYSVKAYQKHLLSEKPIAILDALSASGLRSIRFAKEVEAISLIQANDLSPNAIKLIRKNFALNEITEDSTHVISNEDGNKLMNNNESLFDVIDLDPYGSVIPFIEAGLRASKDGGLICATCTDLKVLEGPDVFKCFAMYNVSRAYGIGCKPENAIRIVLHSIQAAANRMGKTITPLLSFRSDFYLRLFFRVNTGKTTCYKDMIKTGTVYFCEYCQNYKVHHLGIKCDKLKQNNNIKLNKLNLSGLDKCDQCDSPYTVNGPVWLDPLHDLSFVQQVKDQLTQLDPSHEINTTQKVLAFLDNMLSENTALQKQVYSFCIARMTKFLKMSCPRSLQVQSALQSLGFNAQRCYTYKDLIKTDAPFKAVLDVFKQMKINFVGKDKLIYNLKEDSPAYKVLIKEIEYIPDFTFKAEEKKIPIFFPNPEKHWGPKRKAAIRKVIDQQGQDEKAKKVKEDN